MLSDVLVKIIQTSKNKSFLVSLNLVSFVIMLQRLEEITFMFLFVTKFKD